ncbi:hypothetical protein SAMN03080601_00266 [Alkalitalea saponilacus]|uniref:Outer membrane insertion C-terminal signal n=2 Tax=Alkalitalea saponilacus TaxID=889453 RepID=A0A1T5AHG7_9BACT|nr:hypothetical protein SAMN03080601_00266 [Alkalitalea saponilacus]
MLFSAFISINSFSQKGLEVNVNSERTLGFEYWFNNKIAGVMRLHAGVLDGYSVSPMVILNLKEIDASTKLYLGVGFREVEDFETLSIPLGLRVYPFDKMPKFGFTLELENVFGDDYILIPSFGLSYRF